MQTLAVIVLFLIHQAVSDTPAYSVTKSSNVFAHRLYSNLTKDSSDNLLVCPLSLHVSLGLVHQGAGGNTAAELATVLGLFESNQNIREGYLAKLTAMKEEGDTLKIATKLFPGATFEINKEYVGLAQKYFLSDVEGVDYSIADQAARKINKYVEEKTKNKIHDLVSPDSITELTRLIIINAVHFEAPWKTNFSTAYDGDFQTSANKIYRTKMMTQVSEFDYKEDAELGAQVLRMEYGKENFSMIVILPKDVEGLASVEEKLSNSGLETILKGMHNTILEVTIPKFKLEQKIELNDFLQKMGVKDMFNKEKADLHGVAKGEDLFVSDVVQKTFIDVHEAGTKAAAATDTQLVVLSLHNTPKVKPIKFRADHPFFFGLIYNSDTVLFYGRLTHPVS